MADADRKVEELSDKVGATHIDNKWPTAVEKLSCLEKSAIKKGKTDIYPAWKSLLSQWLSNAECKVYLASPFLDMQRMIDICLTVISGKDKDHTGSIETFFLRKKCFNDETYNEIGEKAINEIKETTKKDYSTFIKTNVMDKIASPKPSTNFHAKFIGCINNKEKTARVLVTSANFTYSNLGFDNLESVVCHEMTVNDFKDRFINPLGLICG